MMRQQAIAGFKMRGRRPSIEISCARLPKKIDVRVTPESGHLGERLECPLSAKSGHRLPSTLNSQVVGYGSRRFDNNTRPLIYAVHHRLEGPATKKFISGLPCAATPTIVVNNQDAVRDDQIIKML